MDFLFLLYDFSDLNASALKQFQLLRLWARFNGFGGKEKFHGAKLLVGYAKYSHIAIGRKKAFHALNVHVGIFAAWTATSVN